MNSSKSQFAVEAATETFHQFLYRLDSDFDSAGKRYEEIRQKLIRFFEWNESSRGHELADEVLDRVAWKIKNENIHDVMSFTWGVAKNVLRESRRRWFELGVDDLPPELSPRVAHPEIRILNEGEKLRRLKCLRCCMQRLSFSERELFLQYEYYQTKPGRTLQLAQAMGLSIGALQTRAHRIKQKIEQCTLKCFDSHSGRVKKQGEGRLKKNL